MGEKQSAVKERTRRFFTRTSRKEPDQDDKPAKQERKPSLNDLLDTSCEKYGGQPAIGMALDTPLTYNQFGERVRLIAAALRRDGVKEQSRVAILAENSHNWGTAYLAIVRLGAAVVPILPDLPEADVHHILSEMESEIIFITQRQIEKLYEFTAPLKKVITLDDYVDRNQLAHAEPFTDYLKAAEAEFREELEAGSLEFPEVDGRSLASILYTSGTSGFSKAVMLSHYNMYANAHTLGKLIDLPPKSTFLSVLPISHTYEFTSGFLWPLTEGARIAYVGKTPTPSILKKMCARERPTVMMVVPLIMEKIYKKRVLAAIDQSKLLTTVCKFGVGRRFIYRKIGKKLLDFFGGELMVMGIGGAALNPDVEHFLREAEFPFLIGYGLTESAPLLSGGPFGDTTITPCSSGKPVPGVEIRIADADPRTGIGEIEARGPNIMQGYWNDAEATAETLSADGWLSTGDLGMLDDAGNLHIKGRCKSVIVMASGENIYPEAIEHKINGYSFVVESLVIENNDTLEAWIYPDYELIDEETRGKTRQQRHQYVADLLGEMRREVNRQLPKTSRIARVVERREPFIKTATHKIKRYLYTGESSVK